MRENDAELLEQGVGESTLSPQMSLVHSSIDVMNMLKTYLSLDEEPEFIQGSSYYDTQQNYYKCGLPREAEEEKKSDVGSRRNSFLLDDNELCIHDIGETVSRSTRHTDDPENDFGGERSRKELHRSKSAERRLFEASQFAEALGEFPTANNEIIPEIIELSSDEDDDDDSELFRRGKSHDLPKPTYNKNSSRRRQRTPPSHLLQCLLGGLPTAYGEDPQPAPFVYRGICSNPPEVTRSGMSRGNYAQLHRKAWLEVSDKYHRYGKNLRRYYKHWETLGHPTNMFFDWLDSKGEAAGEPLPNLEECPRSQLDSDTVLYIKNPEISAKYALTVQRNEDDTAFFTDVYGNLVTTGDDGWIFVLRDGIIYAAPKITSVSGKAKKRFHHSSFFGGKAVAAAGIFVTDDAGRLVKLFPHSGHYRPGEAHMQRMLYFLQREGVDLSSFDADMQQIYRVSREKDILSKGGKSELNVRKTKKIDSTYMMPAACVACFLTHKALMIGEGVFEQIHKIQKAKNMTVYETWTFVEGGVFI